MLADLPDLWDVNVSDRVHDFATSRFSSESFQKPYIALVKNLVKKPVISVGRFTSPETTLSLITRGIADFIGSARSSIADPFIPRKIEEGAPRRYPRMHRPQHLCHRTAHENAHAVHTEPDRRRRVAARLAS